MRGRLFWQLFVAQLFIIAVLVGGLGVYFALVVERNIDAVLGTELARTAEVAIAAVESYALRSDDPSTVLARLTETTDLRISIMSSGGVVLADSAVIDGVEDLENHSNRPEVVMSLANGVGTALRMSDTLGQRLLYYARRVEIGNESFVYRVAIPYSQVSSRIEGMRWALLLALILASVGSGAVAWLVARRLSDPLQALSGVVGTMSEGRLDVPIPAVPEGELRVLRSGIERLQTQLSEKLRQVEEEKTLLLTILSAMTEGVIVVDATGRVILVNPMALQLLGVDDVWKRHSVEDRLLIEVTRNPQLIELVERAIRAGEPQREEIESRRGGRRFLKVSIAPLKEADAVRGAVAALHDHTQIRTLERIRRDFVANVSHELRTPIAAIRGWAETLTSDAVELPEFVEEQLLVILRHSERLGALVDDLLTLARVEAQGVGEQRARVDVAGVLGDIVEALGEKLSARAMKVEIAIDPGVEFIQTEPRALEYILRNLVDNAVKYTTEQGKVRVQVAPRDDGWLELRVTDNGSGIEETHLPRIFERFYRIDKGRSRDVGGTGLGLSIVKHFAEAIGGNVSVESELGVGSQFFVLLPPTAWGRVAEPE
jgi:two-component system phosphate regulon sensor histidine kinase PhoR